MNEFGISENNWRTLSDRKNFSTVPTAPHARSEDSTAILTQLEKVDRTYRRSKADRSRLVREAREAGASLGEIAQALGLKRASVQSLLRNPASERRSADS